MAGRHDQGARRRAARKQRERGCHLYIPAEQLVEAGIDPAGPAPWFKTWPGRKRTIIVQLYTEP